MSSRMYTASWTLHTDTSRNLSSQEQDETTIKLAEEQKFTAILPVLVAIKIDGVEIKFDATVVLITFCEAFILADKN